MTANYVLLEKITVGAAGASSVTFNSIPQTGYTDLKVVFSARSNSGFGFDRGAITFNGTTSGYSWRELAADGTTPGSVSYSSQASLFNVTPSINGGTSTASTFGNAELYIPNYTSSNQKSMSFDWVMENNSASAFFVGFDAGLSNITSGITSITIGPTLGSLVANSTFYLYGVAKLGTTPAIVPYATGGDTIMTDGTYWYHAFKSSGTFTPQKALSADILCIAGGGGAGGYGSGGAGAGGVIYFAGSGLAANTGITATIGAGGGSYSNGSNTTFGALTAAVGGGGSNNPGNAGGSGAGCGQGSGAVVSGGASTQTGTGATAFYGNAGGNAINTQNYVGGGGGGAGAAGTSPTGTGRGNGGVGTAAFSSWGLATGTGQNVSGTVYYAGGGGGSSYFNPPTSGGSGGYGGGGNGSTVYEPSKNNTPGTANTGGGGGATQENQAPDSNCNGGSGLVIVRYAV